MTSLATQLSSIRSLNATRLRNASTLTSHASYLFPASVAATQETPTVHALGTSGWAELAAQDAALNKWQGAERLFGEASRETDRLTLDAAENKDIDVAVREFLHRVAPLLLSKAAAKCLEWLVRRFRINEFSVEDVVGAFLPYHETPQFVRMLQICKLSDRPHLAFLVPIQKRGVPLPSSVIVAALSGSARSTPALDTLRFVVALLPTDRRSHRALVAFWVSTLAQLCMRWAGVGSGTDASMGAVRNKKSGAEAEDLVPILLPAALAAATAPRSAAETHTGGLMLLCAIAAAFPLSEEAVQSVLDALLDGARVKEHAGKSERATLAAAYTLVAAASSATDAAELFSTSPDAGTVSLISQAALEGMLKMPNLDAELALASKAYELAPFQTHLIRALIDSPSTAEISNLLAALLSLESTPLELATQAATLLLCPTDARPANHAVLADVRQRRPAVLDDALKALGSGEDAELRARAWGTMRGVLRVQAGGSASADTDDDDDALWLGAHDADAGARALALGSMLEAIQKGALSADDSFVTQVIRARLADAHEDVLAVLYKQPDIVLDALQPEEILSAVFTALDDAELAKAALQLHASFLLAHLVPAHPETATRVLRQALWPRLLHTKARRTSSAALLDALRTAAGAAAYKKAPDGSALAIIRALAGTHGEGADINAELTKALAAGINAAPDAEFEEHLAFLTSQKSGSPRLLAGLVLVRLAASVTEARFAALASAALGTVQLSASAAEEEASATPVQAGDVAPELHAAIFARSSSAKTQRRLYAALVLQLVRSLPIAEDAAPAPGFALGAQSAVRDVALRIYALANASSTGSVLSREILALLFARLRDSALPFLAGLWTAADAPGAPSSTLRTVALKHANAFLSAFLPAHGTQRTVDFQTLLPAFLLALTSEDGPVRLEALACLRTVAAVLSTLTQNGAPEIFAFDAVYGVAESKALTYLDASDVVRFVDALTGSADNFRHDAAYLPVWLGEQLNVTRGVGKKEAQFRRSTLGCLLGHVVCWHDAKTRIRLLEILRAVSDATKVRLLLPLLEELVRHAGAAKGGLSTEQHEAYARLLFGAYDRSSRSAIEDPACAAWKLLLEALASKTPLVQRSAAVALREGLAPSLKPEQLKLVFQLLTEIASSPSATHVPEVGAALAALEVDAALLVPVMSELRLTITHGALDLETQPKAKRSKTAEGEGHSATTRASAVLTHILESALGRKLAPSAPLLTELFEVLRVGVEMHASRLINAEYLLQTTMGVLARLLERIVAPEPDVVTAMRSDTIINVVKTSTNPQTFQQALLLLASVATLAPEPVLHNAMPIFTFVGSSVLQRDDALSFSVVERTLRSIVPPLVASIARAAPQNHLRLLQASRPFVCIFTDAANHVPRHRRDVFFQLFVDVLGEADFLSAVPMLLVDRIAHKVVKQEGAELDTTLHLPLSVLAPHSAAAQLVALNQVWDEALRLWSSRAQDPTEASAHVFLDPLSRIDLEHSGKHPEPSRRVLALLTFIRHAVGARALAAKLGEASEEQADEAIGKSMEVFIQHALHLAAVDDAAIARSAGAALTTIMKLVPVGIFLNVVLQLVADAEPERKQGGFELFASRLLSLTSAQRADVAARTPLVVDAALAVLRDAEAGDTLRAAALDALEVVAASCITVEQGSLAAGIPPLIETGKDAALRSDVFSVLHSLARRLGPRLIPHLAAVVAFSLSSIKEALAKGATAPSGAFSTLAGLVTSVPSFMPAHLPAIIQLSARPALADADLGDAGKSALHTLLNTMVKRMPAQQVFDALASVWDGGDKASKHLNIAVLDQLGRVLRTADRAATASIYKPVFRFMLRVLDLRRQNATNDLDAADLALIEDRCVNTFVRMVLKLNETTFRPLFLRIYDWAALDLVEDDTPVQDEGLCARRLVLYKVINGLMDTLKGLVASYYATVLDLSIELLDAFAAGKIALAKHQDLFAAVVSSLHKSARYDEGSFWSPTRLSKTAPPLVAQLTLTAVAAGTTKEARASNTALVSQAIAALARAMQDEKSVKLINSALLTRARSEDDRVKVAALGAAERVWSQDDLASVLLSLVPETVPHISELLDSDNHEVLETTNAFVSAIESVLGEPLDSYLQ